MTALAITASLTEQQRELVRYMIVEGKPPEEAAQLAGYHPKSAYRTLRLPAVGCLHFLITCSAFSTSSMQPSTKDAKSRLLTFSLSAFSLQNLCRTSSACRFCAASRYSGAIIGLSSEKARVGKSTAINTRKLIRLKLSLLFLRL